MTLQDILTFKTSEKTLDFILSYIKRYLIGFSSMILMPIVVCKAGFFKDGSVCTMCFGNTIKRKAGDSPDCGTDPPCDGYSGLANDQHTGCGLYFCSTFTCLHGNDGLDYQNYFKYFTISNLLPSTIFIIKYFSMHDWTQDGGRWNMFKSEICNLQSKGERCGDNIRWIDLTAGKKTGFER